MAMPSQTGISKRYQVVRVVQAYYAKKASMPQLDPSDAKEIQYGKRLLGLVSANLSTANPPLRGVDNDDLRRVMAYVILRRENPVLERGDHINFEGAVLAKEPTTFEDRKALEEQFVNQVNRLEGLLPKKLEYVNGKVRALES